MLVTELKPGEFVIVFEENELRKLQLFSFLMGRSDAQLISKMLESARDLFAFMLHDLLRPTE